MDDDIIEFIKTATPYRIVKEVFGRVAVSGKHIENVLEKAAKFKKENDQIVLLPGMLSSPDDSCEEISVMNVRRFLLNCLSQLSGNEFLFNLVSIPAIADFVASFYSGNDANQLTLWNMTDMLDISESETVSEIAESINQEILSALRMNKEDIKKSLIVNRRAFLMDYLDALLSKFAVKTENGRLKLREGIDTSSSVTPFQISTKIAQNAAEAKNHDTFSTASTEMPPQRKRSQSILAQNFKRGRFSANDDGDRMLSRVPRSPSPPPPKLIPMFEQSDEMKANRKREKTEKPSDFDVSGIKEEPDSRSSYGSVVVEFDPNATVPVDSGLNDNDVRAEEEQNVSSITIEEEEAINLDDTTPFCNQSMTYFSFRDENPLNQSTSSAASRFVSFSTPHVEVLRPKPTRSSFGSVPTPERVVTEIRRNDLIMNIHEVEFDTTRIAEWSWFSVLQDREDLERMVAAFAPFSEYDSSERVLQLRQDMLARAREFRWKILIMYRDPHSTTIARKKKFEGTPVETRRLIARLAQIFANFFPTVYNREFLIASFERFDVIGQFPCSGFASTLRRNGIVINAAFIGPRDIERQMDKQNIGFSRQLFTHFLFVFFRLASNWIAMTSLARTLNGNPFRRNFAPIPTVVSVLREVRSKMGFYCPTLNTNHQ